MRFAFSLWDARTWCLCVLLALCCLLPAHAAPPNKLAVPNKATAQEPYPNKEAYCPGSYAKDPAVLNPGARQEESRARYTFCLRSTAVYQCLYFGPTGKVRRRREIATTHGTAFAFRRQGNFTYFLTNEHLTDWPYVTSTETKVEGISAGCRRASQTLSLVDNEHDRYAKDDTALQLVLADSELDVSILKGPFNVSMIPFAVGQSADLEAGDVVQVRGFPLGAFQAVSLGKVINPREPDNEGEWDHYDFVTDAQLSGGNSGSPVLAVSCKSRRFELVGIYHAAYREGQSLNVVVGIDEFRELLTSLKPRRKRGAHPAPLTAADRRRLIEQIRRQTITPLFPFGGQVFGVRVTKDGRLLYELYSKEFPLADWRLVVLEDLPTADFGRIGRLWFGDESGLVERLVSSLRAEDRYRLFTLVESLRHYMFSVLRLREQEIEAKKTRAAYEQLLMIRRQLEREEAEQRSLLKGLVEAAGRYAPDTHDRVVPFSTTLNPGPVPAAPVTGKPLPTTTETRTQASPSPGAGATTAPVASPPR